MKLYELTTNYLSVMEMAEEMDTDTLKDTLESIEEEIHDKAENIAKLIKNINADVDALKSEEKRLADRRKSLENKVTHLKDYLQNQLEVAGLDKVKRPTITVALQNNPPSLEIENEELIPADFKIPQPDKIDKKNLLVYLKTGLPLEGVRMVQKRGLRIK